jgi:hypothetical protein
MIFFLKFLNENKNIITLTIEKENLKVFELIEEIKKELLKHEIFFNPLLQDIELYFSDKEMEKEKTLLEYNCLTNSDILIKFIQKDIFSFSLFDEEEKKNEKFICKFCFSVLKEPIKLNCCGKYVCENCFNFLKINQIIDIEPNNQFELKIEKKNLNEKKKLNCFFCKNNYELKNKIENENENEIEKEIKKFFDEKKKSFEKICEYENEDCEIVCDKKATIKCLDCIKTMSLFCEECFKKSHRRKAYQNHQKTNFVNNGKKKKNLKKLKKKI